MAFALDDSRPIYIQIAEQIEDAILSGAYPEESQIPSTTEFSAICRINPATVLKGFNLLVERQILYKKRGLGMFVSPGAIQAITATRKERFYESYVRPLAAEAHKLGLREEDLTQMIKRCYSDGK